MERIYQAVNEGIVRELETLCGEGNVLYGDPRKLEKYSRDQVAEVKYRHLPEAVVKPRAIMEISEIMKLANREGIPVTPRGAGSGLSGGAVPIHGGIVLSMERMNTIHEIDTADMMCVVEPGVVTNHLDKALEPHGLFFAGYPMSDEFCFIGGNVAENAGGGRAIKYGVTGRYITGLEIVLPNGDTVVAGGKRVKDVTGYDLVHLMVGSEGTLGIITKIWVKLLPRPKSRRTLIALFPDPGTAVGVVPIIMTQAGIIPTSVEFIDRLCLHRTCVFLKETLPYREAGAMLLFEVDGNNPERTGEEAEIIGRICRDKGAREVFVADKPEEAERFWKIRKSITWALKKYSPHQSLEDIVVPMANIPDVIPELERIGREFDIDIPCYGHAGDGNLHATPVKNPDHSMEKWEEILPEVLVEIYRMAARFGGTISGEHGIGHKRKPYMKHVLSEVALNMMRGIKHSLDPNHIMNPGKIFD